MARRAEEACFICEQAPCACGKPSRAPAKPKAMPSVAAALPAAPAAPKQMPKLKLPSAPASSVAIKPRMSKLHEVLDQNEIDLRNALTAIVSVFEIPVEDLIAERHRILLPKWKVDAMIWKATSG